MRIYLAKFQFLLFTMDLLQTAYELEIKFENLYNAHDDFDNAIS